MRQRPPGTVPLSRALSKLGLLSRSEAIDLILAGRVVVDRRTVRDPGLPVVPERARIAIDTREQATPARTTLLLHKPRGVVTTRRDPDGRPTAYDLVREAGTRLAPVGRLDLATSGLLLMTNDTRLSAWLTDPASAVPRVYVLTVRGLVTSVQARQLESGVVSRRERISAASVRIRKASARETHLVITLTEGRNREVRRLCEAIGHEVTRLKRVALGGLELGDLEPGRWRAVSRRELEAAFPGAPISE